MPLPATDLLPDDEAKAQGASAPGMAIVLTLGKDARAPHTVNASNVRSMRFSGAVLSCEGVVMKEPVVFGDEFIFVESTAPLLGFYNAAPGYLAAAYGKPVLHRAWKVTIGQTFRPHINMAPAVHYEGLNLQIVSEIIPSTPDVETPK